MGHRLGQRLEVCFAFIVHVFLHLLFAFCVACFCHLLFAFLFVVAALSEFSVACVLHLLGLRRPRPGKMQKEGTPKC